MRLAVLQALAQATRDLEANGVNPVAHLADGDDRV